MNGEQTKRSLLAFAYAIRKAGGQQKMAMVLDCSQPRISRISNETSEITATMAVSIERHYGVPRYDLRPDLYDRPPKTKAVDYAALIAKHDRARPKSGAAASPAPKGATSRKGTQHGHTSTRG